MAVRVQEMQFDPGAELNLFSAGHTDVGAIVSFSGLVRRDDGLRAMQIEHYAGMTEKALSKIEAEATARWSLKDSLIIHRFGTLHPGETIMMVATAAGHRGEAFQAAEFLMDFLKSRAPFWKKEIGRSGESWVAAKDSDEAALTRW